MASDGTGFRHGIAAYKRRGCRCDVCRAAKAAENERYRAAVAARERAEAHARADELDVGALCREWDCERPALAGGYCRAHGGRP